MSTPEQRQKLKEHPSYIELHANIRSVKTFIKFVGIISFLVFIFYKCDSSGSNAPANNDLGPAAYVVSQNFISMRLKAPSTADYPWYDESFIAKEGKNQYLVKAYVDAQNGFGAKIRTGWMCELKYNSGNESDPNSWTLIEATLFDQ